MASQYFAILTDYGTRAIAHALSQGQPLQLTQFAVGDGNGKAVTPTASATALVHQTHIAPVSAVSLDPRNNKQVIVELTIPENVGGFYIREMGVFDSQNKLIAYANCPESFKPTESSGSGKVQVLRMILKVESSSAVTLSIDNSVIFVTRQQMAPKTITATTQNGFDESGHSHEINKASTTQQGITQLTNDTGLESESLALTAKAGKKLAQLIATVQLALNNYIPLNKRSSAVNSNDENNVATSKAVKTAYDKGVEAKNAADNAQRTANDGVSKATAAQKSANDAQRTANDGVSKATAAQKSANDANNNANGRVSKNGDTITGKLRFNSENENSWAGFEIGTKQGKWTFEANPNSHEAGQRRFNAFYDGGGKRMYLAFPHVGDNGDTVAYQSWVEGSYLPLTGGKITGNLEIDRGNDYAGVILHNKSKIAIIESTPDSENQFLNLIYRTRDNQNVNVVKVPKKTGTLALLEDIKNVHRRDYNRTINGTSNWDNGKSKTITLTGSVTIYPDGRIVQILHLKNFRIMWFDAESPTVGYANAGYRHPLIKIPLWSAMPNKILSAMPQMVRTTHPTTSTTYVSEAGEWISAWAIREQGNDKGNVYINTRRFTGDADEIVDLYVVIEGY
nr:MAG TPA: tail collar fiber protein [Caudoviricetes sp.]